VDAETPDGELVSRLAAGRQEALGPLYARYAPLVFGVAAQSLDRAAAEEIVQDVFLAVWRKAADFDAQQGTFRAWVLQLAHWRVLNELRRRSRRPRLDGESDALETLPDLDEADPADRLWREEWRAVIRSAMNALPAAQRQAVSLAFFGDLTHAQVADALDLPLGTAKTRIRSGLQALRVHLAPIATALVLVAGLLAAGVRAWQTQLAVERDERALALTTSSDVVPLHLSSSAGLPEATHGSYRGRPGASIAVLTVSELPPAPPGQVYAAWVQHAGMWTFIGTVTSDANGSARLIGESPALAEPVTAVEVTLEPSPNPTSPGGAVVLAT
jgi:RNA polymerase sigma-70 factor (ECF subfamily)